MGAPPWLVLALAPALFGGLDGFVSRQTGWLAEACRAAAVPPGRPRVRLPGEPRFDRKRRALAEGVVPGPRSPAISTGSPPASACRRRHPSPPDPASGARTMTANPSAADYRAAADRSLALPSRAFIDGAWRPAVAGRTFENRDPATGAVLGQVAHCDGRDVDLAVAAARRAFEDSAWSRAAPEERKAVLLRAGRPRACQCRGARRDGEPRQRQDHPDCLNEIGHEVPTFFQWYAELADKSFGKVAPTGEKSLAMIVKEPVGVVGLVLPWNFPLLMAA